MQISFVLVQATDHAQITRSTSKRSLTHVPLFSSLAPEEISRIARMYRKSRQQG